MNSPDTETDQTIVINDLLNFVWCKLKLFKKKVILKCIQEFYSKEEACEALKTLLTALPNEQDTNKISSLYEYPFISILTILKKCSNNPLPLFVCKDLNNVPKVETFIANDYNSYSIESKREFYLEHQRIKRQLDEVFSSLHDLKSQFQVLMDDGALSADDEFINTSNGHDTINIPPRDFLYHQTLTDDEDIEEFAIRGIDNVDGILEQRINLLANRRQRASLKVSRKDEETEIRRGNFLSPKQKIIHIGKDKQVSVLDSSEPWNDSYDEDELTNEAEIEILRSPKSENLRYIICEHHFEENIGYITIFKCSVCGFCSNDEATCMEHFCAKVSYSQANGNWNSPVKSTYNKAREKNIYDCHSCGASFKMKKELEKHVDTHLKGGHRCPLCANRFAVDEWQRHVRTCPGNGSSSREDHYCELCDVFYSDRRTLSLHKAFHDQSRPFECVECKYRFYTQKAVEDHFRIHKLQASSKKCPFCDFHCTKPTKIVDHIRSHTGDRPYKCSHCDRGCPTFNALKVHLTSHVPTRNFPCNICGKKFKSQSKVAVHRKIHTVERPHKCPLCGKGFKFGLQMAMHHRMHLDIRKHPCSECPYKARTAAILRGHMNTHTQSKPYKCNKCPFGANHKSYLNWHKKCYHPNLESPDDDHL